jgi:predicted acyl esterase
LAAKLFLASTTSDADVFVVLQLFDPTGGEVTFPGAVEPRAPIAQGWLRASHRKLDPSLSTPYRPFHAHDEIQPLTPGRMYEVEVEMWPTCIVVPAGYTLAFTVQGRDLEREVPSGRLGPWEGLRGSGPFLHNHPWDRRPEVYAGRVTIYGGGPSESHLLVPVISGNLP